MKTPKHTKGPWMISMKKSSHTTISGSIDNQLIPIADNVTQANAALIAAAPEMLEALEDLYQSIKDCSEFCDAMKSSGFDIDVVESIQRAKQVIRKAKGE